MNDHKTTGAHRPAGSESTVDYAAPDKSPRQIGRYCIKNVLGKGGFGLVYLAHDEQLDRLVAIKVPHARLIAQPSDAEAYLTEARTVANLDHPNIVPVHDVGSTEEFPCYVVSKYIDGADLSTRLKHSPLSLHEAVEVVATAAEALHHAHKQGLVHRDIKPGVHHERLAALVKEDVQLTGRSSPLPDNRAAVRPQGSSFRPALPGR